MPAESPGAAPITTIEAVAGSNPSTTSGGARSMLIPPKFFAVTLPATSVHMPVTFNPEPECWIVSGAETEATPDPAGSLHANVTVTSWFDHVPGTNGDPSAFV